MMQRRPILEGAGRRVSLPREINLSWETWRSNRTARWIVINTYRPACP